MSNPYAELSALVFQDGNKNETECGKYLPYVLPRLLSRTPKSIVSMTFEDRSYYGSSDFAVSANFEGDTGNEEIAVYIWEIKAPQCNLMLPDSNRNRFCPSPDLYKAENQLIHYVHQARHDNLFRDRFKVGATGPVIAGGIIIGRDDTIVASQHKAKLRDAQTSLNIRKETLYRHEGLKVLTWNRILAYLKTPDKPVTS